VLALVGFSMEAGEVKGFAAGNEAGEGGNVVCKELGAADLVVEGEAEHDGFLVGAAAHENCAFEVMAGGIQAVWMWPLRVLG